MHPLDCQGKIKANLVTVVIDNLTQIPVDSNKNLNMVQVFNKPKKQIIIIQYTIKLKVHYEEFKCKNRYEETTIEHDIPLVTNSKTHHMHYCYSYDLIYIILFF